MSPAVRQRARQRIRVRPADRRQPGRDERDHAKPGGWDLGYGPGQQRDVIVGVVRAGGAAAHRPNDLIEAVTRSNPTTQ